MHTKISAWFRNHFALFVTDADGSQLKKIPEEKATMWATYAWQTRYGGITFNGTYSYTGEYYDQGVERDLDLVPDRFRVDLSAMWRDMNQVWSVRVFVNNATDEENLRDIGSGTEATNWRLTGAILTPRIYGIDIRYSFGG